MAVFLRYFGGAALYVVLELLVCGLLESWSAEHHTFLGLQLAHLHLLCQAVLRYGAFALGLAGLLIFFNVAPRILGKSSRTGQVPFWSFMIFWSVHAWNHTFVQLMYRKRKRRGIEAATEVISGWYLGSWFLDEVEAVGKEPWACVVDLTNEFGERAAVAEEDYYHLPTWDGQPPDEAMFEDIGKFISARANKSGPVVVHCAFGVGRSTCVLCAALVVAGKFANYADAFEAIKKKRPVARLNHKMRRALRRWQAKRDKGQ
mmetsp:Transcript_33104/g.55459  ORF Transcript_33104/g.55459 Transcript_33104/m.55459 type:complete len:260 (-) Transcript_33104:78-857(-)